MTKQSRTHFIALLYFNSFLYEDSLFRKLGKVSKFKVFSSLCWLNLILIIGTITRFCFEQFSFPSCFLIWRIEVIALTCWIVTRISCYVLKASDVVLHAWWSFSMGSLALESLCESFSQSLRGAISLREIFTVCKGLGYLTKFFFFFLDKFCQCKFYSRLIAWVGPGRGMPAQRWELVPLT